jgi:hypothetical protein
LIDCQTDYSPNNPKVFITNMKTLTTSTNLTAEDDRRLERLRLQGLRLPLGLRPLLVGRRLGHNTLSNFSAPCEGMRQIVRLGSARRTFIRGVLCLESCLVIVILPVFRDLSIVDINTSHGCIYVTSHQPFSISHIWYINQYK